MSDDENKLYAWVGPHGITGRIERYPHTLIDADTLKWMGELATITGAPYQLTKFTPAQEIMSVLPDSWQLDPELVE